MTDRELLELAAKAAGIELVFSGNESLSPRQQPSWEIWNPLTDDGDALRLAVKLELEPYSDSCFIGIRGVEFEEISEDKYCDPYAATRRAIVRAAAEIGKAA